MIASISVRSSSGRRTTRSKRRSPSNTRPAVLPPTAISTRFCTSDTLMPKRASALRSSLTVSTGSPATCSVLTSAAPWMFCSADCTCPAIPASTSRSSPKILTPTSLRTPEISSLKRSWIGCESSYRLPATSSDAASISFIRSSFGFFGSGHWSRGLSMTIAVRDRRRHRIGRHLRGAGAGEGFLHLWNPGQPPLERHLHLERLREAGSGDAHRLDRDVALVEARDELAAHPRRGVSAHDDQRHGRGRHDDAQTDREIEQRHIGPARGAHEPVLLLGDLAGHEQRDSGRNEGHRQDAGAQQRHQHGQRHRREHLAFDAGQREHRQIDHGDDQRAEQAGLDDLARRFDDRLEAFLAAEQAPSLRLFMGEQTQAVLHDDDGAIDDDAEIDGAEAHQSWR